MPSEKCNLIGRFRYSTLFDWSYVMGSDSMIVPTLKHYLINNFETVKRHPKRGRNVGMEIVSNQLGRTRAQFDALRRVCAPSTWRYLLLWG